MKDSFVFSLSLIGVAYHLVRGCLLVILPNYCRAETDTVLNYFVKDRKELTSPAGGFIMVVEMNLMTFSGRHFFRTN